MTIVDRPDRTGLPQRTTALVVGGGPVGLLTAILLDRQGIDSHVVERRADLQAAPAAHVINARTFEICRAAGVDFDRIDDACQPPEDGAWVRWVTSLTGEELGSVPFERQHEIHLLDALTPTPLRNLSQHRFEPILRDHLATLPSSDVSYGVEWVSAVQTDAEVVSTVRDVESGETYEITSAYLIAADGAGSPVRRSLGIQMDGPTRLNATVTIHAEADLRHLVEHRPATLYWVTDPDHEGVFVAHDLDNTWVFMRNWNPDTEKIEDYTVERCEELFRNALGTEDVDFTVRTISPWMMTCQVARAYRAGRMFLVGDAAHRFPPTGGLGLNTGAVDAQNLAWKLGAVERGWADRRLLASYEKERRPIAHDNSQQSLNNAMRTLEVRAALGMSDDPETSRAAYRSALSTEGGREKVRRAIENQAEHFDMLGLQLGFVYHADGGTIVDDGTELPLPDDPVRDYLPTTHPGARLPHAWVARFGQRISTLDLVAPDRCVLITSSPAWAAVADQIVPGEVPLDVCFVGRDVDDVDGAWAKASGLPSSGALLVRPDQHIAWRSTAVAGDPSGALQHALRVVSGR